ncbi:MAG TPA: response regulator [Bryobacteraceae bacterium]|nr:response regulator [Bryobacteraceae bacterium]
MVNECPKARVMIVEDEALIAEDLETRLLNLGYQVTAIADSATDAFTKIEETGPDLVMMDIRLRGSADGIAAAEVIRDNYRLPVIFLTAFGDGNTLERAKLAEPFGFMVKPVVTTQLPTTIEVALHKHKIEEQLQRERAWLETTLSSIADPTLVTDAEGRIRFINETASKLLGLDSSYVVGQTLTGVINFTRPGETTPIGDLVRTGLLHGSVMKVSCDCQVAGGGPSIIPSPKIPVECTVAVSRTATEFVGVVVTLRDLRASRSMEQHLREDQKMVAVGRLSAAIAHDFNSLLTIIMGCVEEIAVELDPENAAVAPLTSIKDAAASAAALTRQLLSFTHKAPGRKDLVDVSTLVQKQVKAVKRILGPKVALSSTVGSGSFVVNADANEIQQVLLNLILNARDAMPGGGAIAVQVARASAPLHDEAGVPEDVIRIAVSDTGTGMSRDLMENIFEPFFTTKPAGQGTGLGLTIIRTIVAGLGGRISVESAVGAGTTFEVLLPAAYEPGTACNNEQGSACTPTVLIVEEEEGVRRLLHQYFEDKGYNLLEAATTAEAVALAEVYEGKISVVITDAENYVEAMTVSHPELRFLLASASAPTPAAAGRLSYISKPFTKQDLLSSVQALVSDSLAVA